MSTLPSHEWTKLVQVLGLQTATEILQIFASRVQERTNLMTELLQKQDYQKLAEEIHGVKSSCLAVGASRASALCESLRTRILAGVDSESQEQVRHQLEELIQEFQVQKQMIIDFLP